MIYDKTYNAFLEQKLESVTCNTYWTTAVLVRKTSKGLTASSEPICDTWNHVLLNLGSKFSHIGKSSISWQETSVAIIHFMKWSSLFDLWSSTDW